MYSEYRNTYTVPFVGMVLDSFSHEENPFF